MQLEFPHGSEGGTGDDGEPVTLQSKKIVLVFSKTLARRAVDPSALHDWGKRVRDGAKFK